MTDKTYSNLSFSKARAFVVVPKFNWNNWRHTPLDLLSYFTFIKRALFFFNINPPPQNREKYFKQYQQLIYYIMFLFSKFSQL